MNDAAREQPSASMTRSMSATRRLALNLPSASCLPDNSADGAVLTAPQQVPHRLEAFWSTQDDVWEISSQPGQSPDGRGTRDLPKGGPYFLENLSPSI